jgi:hypothetical protein
MALIWLMSSTFRLHPLCENSAFLCHASQDKPAVRKLFASLKSESWIDPWQDEENLLPGRILTWRFATRSNGWGEY